MNLCDQIYELLNIYTPCMDATDCFITNNNLLSHLKRERSNIYWVLREISGILYTKEEYLSGNITGHFFIQGTPLSPIAPVKDVVDRDILLP